jgi:flagellar basal body-associated protein FliL
MNGTARWQKSDIYWIAAIVALCVLVAVGCAMYYGMGVRLDEPRKKGAQAAAVIVLCRSQAAAHSWTSGRV